MTTATETKSVAKAKTQKPAGEAVVKKPRAATPPDATVTQWATFGVVFTLILSALLNGYANAQHAPVAWAGWGMGLSIPVIILFLAKLSGEKWLKNHKGTAKLAGGSGLALLVLSVWHCGESIALLTGSSLWLALPMAVAIDCGLVACELCLITEKKTKRAK